MLKFKLNRQPYVEVACGRQQPPPGSVWAAGLMDVLGDRWNGVSGALGASNGSHGPHDANKCSIVGVGKFNIKLPYPARQPQVAQQCYEFHGGHQL